MEKNGVFSRVRSRWRSIFSKKSNPVKLRDCNRLTFERILSDPDEQIGTILAQATVEPITLPNGGGIALIQETTLYEEEPVSPKEEKPSKSSSRRFRRLSSGDLNVIRRMTEEIVFDLKNVVYDGNEITGEPDEENGIERACFKPGPNHPTDQQMLFLKQCLKKVETRPPNMYYLTNGWTIDNFEALFKYMIRSGEDCSRESLLRIEFRNCVVSLDYLRQFIEEYAAFKGVTVEADYVYATVHSKTAAAEKKLKGAMAPFVEVESRVRKARISYASTFILNSPHTPNVTVVVRFCCAKPCNLEKGRKRVQIMVQVDHLTGHPRMPMSEAMRVEGIGCHCLEDFADEAEQPALELVPERPLTPIATIVTDRDMLIDDEEAPQQLSYNCDSPLEEKAVSEHMFHDQTDITSDIAVNYDVNDYVEMFPTILHLFDKAGIRDVEDDEVPVKIPCKYPRKKESVAAATVSSEGRDDETDEYADTQSITSSDSDATSSAPSTDSSTSDEESVDSEASDNDEHLEKL